MSLTRRHYVDLAACLGDARPRAGEMAEGWRRAVNAVADALESDNPRFDRERFVVACEAAGAGEGGR